MKKRPLLLFCFALFLSISAFSENYYYYRFRFEMHPVTINGGKDSYPVVLYHVIQSNISNDYLIGTDVITAVDGKSTKNLTQEEVYSLFDKKESASFAIIRWNKKMTININGLPCICPPWDVVSEDELRNMVNYYQFSHPMNKTPDYNIYRDYNIDFYKYTTYDFRYSEGGCPVSDKKAIGDAIDNFLQFYGLKRNTENPQMLFFIELYADKKEQYVPPTSTTYSYYSSDVDWQGNEIPERLHVSSYQKNGYTDVTYLYKIAISVMDAEKYKSKPSSLPVLWSMSYSKETKNKYSIKEIAKNNLENAFVSFKPINIKIPNIYENSYYKPLKAKEENGKYLDIFFDKNNPSVLAAVEPDGAGAKGGLEMGSKIISYTIGNNIDHLSFKYNVNSAIDKYEVENIPGDKNGCYTAKYLLKDKIPVHKLPSSIQEIPEKWGFEYIPYVYMSYYFSPLKITFQNNGQKEEKKEFVPTDGTFSPIYEFAD